MLTMLVLPVLALGAYETVILVGMNPNAQLDLFSISKVYSGLASSDGYDGKRAGTIVDGTYGYAGGHCRTNALVVFMREYGASADGRRL